MAVKKFKKGIWNSDIGMDEERDERFSILISNETETFITVYGNSIEECEANGNLVSAAPELIDCVEAMLHTMTGSKRQGSIFWNQCCAAYKKAYGIDYCTKNIKEKSNGK